MIKRTYYTNSILNFLVDDNHRILGELARNHNFSLDELQKNAWIAQITLLKNNLHKNLSGNLFFEFAIPRMGKRVDVILIVDGLIFVLEFKTGSANFDQSAINQTVDYALDLKNFHKGSHNRHIVPVLVSLNATAGKINILWAEDKIATHILSNGNNLDLIIEKARKSTTPQKLLEADAWVNSGYQPTPTIIEAAQALYEGHSVENISRSDAGASNLSNTSDCLFKIIKTSKKQKRKSICFVTGVPGAGKTLAGLNISTSQLKPKHGETGVFLSGNGPLVKVLREALTRNEVKRAKDSKLSISKMEALSRVSTFIQNIHHFRDESLKSDQPPLEKVVIFDEAQRAWDQKHVGKFMSQKRGIADFNMSEPEFLISIMDRHNDWCTIVCLVGNGQEINTGEAGILEWFQALHNNFPGWDVYISPNIEQLKHSQEKQIFEKLKTQNITKTKGLNLEVSIRSFRAEKLSAFVHAIINSDEKTALKIYRSIYRDYPIEITRDIDHARNWLRQKARGSERYGLIASSGGLRLKPEGLNVKTKIDPVHWFLNEQTDVRSSYYLEDVATEFDIQGLELDWSCVCWDADFRIKNQTWTFHQFKGTKWQNIIDPLRKVYLANAYRVLLTRARQGMVIFIPKGNNNDISRPPRFYDETYSFLVSCGIPKIK